MSDAMTLFSGRISLGCEVSGIEGILTYVSIEGDFLCTEFSVPLDEVGMKGRYANGVSLVTLKLGDDGLARIELVSATLNGKPLPRRLQNWFNKQSDLNIAQRVLTDARIGRHLESIEIRDGVLVFNPINSN